MVGKLVRTLHLHYLWCYVDGALGYWLGKMAFESSMQDVKDDNI